MHRANFDPNEVQVSTLLSIKTGACPEDCAYCSQSIRFETGLKSEPLMDLEEVLEKARIARANGATRFCMGAAYRSPKPKQLDADRRDDQRQCASWAWKPARRSAC